MEKVLYFKINNNGKVEEISITNCDGLEDYIKVTKEEFEKMLLAAIEDDQNLQNRIYQTIDLQGYYLRNNNLERFNKLIKNLVKRKLANYDYYSHLIHVTVGIENKKKQQLREKTRIIPFMSNEYIKEFMEVI